VKIRKVEPLLSKVEEFCRICRLKIVIFYKYDGKKPDESQQKSHAFEGMAF